MEQNLCADDEEEDEEKEGEEVEDDEEGNEEINNEIEDDNKNEINVNDKNDKNIDDNKKTNKDSGKVKIFGNKNGLLTKEDLDTILDNLLIDDQNEKLNTIIIIHENICGKYEQNKETVFGRFKEVWDKYESD